MPTSRSYRFALVAHALELINAVREVAQDPSITLESHLVDFETAVPTAKECLENGAEVIICHGGTGNSIIRAVGHSAVSIDRTDGDVLKTIRTSGITDREVIYAGHIDEEHDFEQIEDLLDIRIHNIKYPNSKILFKKIDELFSSGVKVLLGGGVSSRYMDELGGKGHVIVTNRNSIKNALNQARAMADQKRQFTSQYENLLTVFRQLDEGVICINAEGDLIFINQKAMGMLNVRTDRIKNINRQIFSRLNLFDALKNRKAYHDSFMELKGEQFVVTTLPVTIQQGNPGAVALFRDVPSLQKINRKIGEELYAKGFISRYGLEDIKGGSPGIKELIEKVRRFARYDSAVLIQGETGTGKELIAHSLHSESARRDKPFVAINFAALPAHLLESELFGYEEGAFTGARRGGKAGFFELANQGTLFLDEVGEISHEMQLRLLRVLEAKEVMRVGGSRFLPVDVRVISASHQPLPELVAEKKFRLDLFYRLSTLKLHMPPLRERLTDVPFLMQPLLSKHGKAQTAICKNIIKLIYTYRWPGNIRELLAVMESYLVQLDANKSDSKLFASILNENAKINQDEIPVKVFFPEVSMQENLKRIRKEIAVEALAYHDGDKKKAAKQLGINYSTLWRIMHPKGKTDNRDTNIK